ncbi:hypothetical protein [Hyphococcus luteus]|uniref:Uncharacterized protein n=1 Tax=Hyphococcus luteus TaxID=2058213 RepID=A0A2S7K4P9_9PROT|nr:hypothetical protein [Marinicaulis flavus]PQA87484.1 hypothetical protein CW354_11820 [Marinicaulis flavus]
MDAALSKDPAQKRALEVLRARIRAVSAPPLSEAAQILVDALGEKYPGGAIVFYGSGASVSKTDDPANVIFDFYVIGETYETLYSSPALRLANRLLPPNVFYFETPSSFGTLRAKVAVLTLAHFEKLAGEKTFHSYFWGRFAQPCRIHGADEAMTARLETALAEAIAMFCRQSAGLMSGAFTPRALWLAGLAASYKAELRAEDETRAGKLLDSYGDWAETVTAPALTLAGLSNSVADGKITLDAPPPSSAFAWRARAVQGAFLSVARLLKGTQTFKGGIDYIAWKIKRHSGIDIGVTEWERRHPLLGAPGAALRYYRLRAKRKGA